MNEDIKRRLNSGNTCYVKFGPEFFVLPFLLKNVTREMYTSVFFHCLIWV